MRLVYENMVDAHLPEVHHIVRPRLYRVFPLLGSPYKYRVICLICYYQFRMCSGMGAVANLRIIERQSEVVGFHRSVLYKFFGFIDWIIQM